MVKILGLDVSGNPKSWLSLEDAVTYHAKGYVAWQHGVHSFSFRGGYQKNGEQSKITTSSIVAVRSVSGFTVDKIHRDLPITNKLLFKRDLHTCGYCGKVFKPDDLSRDHIIPTSRGGRDIWTNIITACKHCNCMKDDQLLSECNMHILHKPYAPTRVEVLFAHNQFKLDEQIEYMLPLMPKHSRFCNYLKDEDYGKRS